MLFSHLYSSGPTHHFEREVVKSRDEYNPLKGQKIGILFESDFYEHEIWYYHYRFAEEGAEVHLLTRLWGQTSITFTGHEYKAPMECHESFEDMLIKEGDDEKARAVADAKLESYSAIIVPSGIAPDRLRYTEDLSKLPPATEFLKRAFTKDNVLKGIICHGLWLVAPAPELVRGRPVTCHNNLHGDAMNMGAVFTDQDVVVDGDLVTGRSGAHCHLFAKKIIQILSGKNQ